MQRLLRQHRQEDVEVEGERRDEQDGREDDAGERHAANEGERLAAPAHERRPLVTPVEWEELLRPDQQQAGEHGDETDGVEQEAGARARGGDNRAAERGADHPRPVEETRVERDGVRQLVPPDQLEGEGLPRRLVDDERDASQPGEQVHHPGLDDAAKVTPASTAAKTIDAACVTITVRRMSRRSTSTPLKSPSTVAGRNWHSIRKPTATGEWVSCSTSHAAAMFCIHVPVTETTWPEKKIR